MTQLSLKRIFIAVFLAGIFVSHIIFLSSIAQATHTGNPADHAGSAENTGDSLSNPLQSDSIAELFNAILDIVIIIAVPIIVFFIILAGFKYVTAQGDSEAVKKATSMFTWAVIGGVLILGAKVLVEIIQNTVNAF